MSAECITNADWQLSLYLTRIEELAKAVSSGSAIHHIGAQVVSDRLDNARDTWCIAHQAAAAYQDAIKEMDGTLDLVGRRLQWERREAEKVAK